MGKIGSSGNRSDRPKGGAVLFAAAITLIAASPALAVEVHGHRGARGLAPENTLPAFERAIHLGVDVLELDVGVTADGQVVVTHDLRLHPEIARMPNGRYVAEPGPTIRSLTYPALQLFDVGVYKPDSLTDRRFPEVRPVPGTRIPLLSEVFALAARIGPPELRFSIETKLEPMAPSESIDPTGFVRAILGVVDAAGKLDRVMLQSFDWRTLTAARLMAPDIPRVHLTFQSSDWDTVEERRSGASPWLDGLDADDFPSVPDLVKSAGGTVWSPYYENLDEESLARAKALGLRVVVWTVNDPSEMADLITMGVDGIITDYPNRLLRLLGR